MSRDMSLRPLRRGWPQPCPSPLAFSAPASAATLNNGGPVSLNTTGSITSGTPYSSGQMINISVAANSTLSLTNLESNGYGGRDSP